MTDARTRRIELWMRSSVPVDIRRAQLDVDDRLRQCRATGSIDEVSVHTWERDVYVPVNDREPTGVWEKIDEFRRWAGEHGRELRPGFVRRHLPSVDADDPVEAIRLPIMCLAIYDDRSLQTVAPCSDGARVFTVYDCLRALETGSDPAVGPSPGLSIE